MKTALLYATRTDHSKKIADAIAKSLQIKAQDVKTKPELQEVDLLFVVARDLRLAEYARIGGLPGKYR